VKRVIAFTYIHKLGNGLYVSLKVARIVDNGAPIFALTQLGDLNGIKTLLTQQQASPFDARNVSGEGYLNSKNPPLKKRVRAFGY